MDNVLLTGANGFVGLNIAEQLLAQGYGVHAYVRPDANTVYLEQMPVKIFRGQLKDDSALDNALTGCRHVIHTAGNTSCYQKDYPVLESTNVQGTRSVLQAASKAGIERLVFTSTTSTIGARSDRTYRADESDSLNGFRARSPYAASKKAAERLVLQAQDDGIDVIILNLAEVVGAYDYNLQWGRMILAVSHDQVPFIPPGGGSFCSARNAAMAHVNALSKGQSGERYIISGADHACAEFVQRIAERLNTQFTPHGNYYWLRFKAAGFVHLPVLFRQVPLVDPYRMRVFGSHYYFDSAKAQKDLGYQVADLDAMLDQAIAWYGDNGFLK